MKKNKNSTAPKENLEITKQKLWQREERRPQVEKLTLLKETKKRPAHKK